MPNPVNTEMAPIRIAVGSVDETMTAIGASSVGVPAMGTTWVAMVVAAVAADHRLTARLDHANKNQTQ